MDNITRLIEVIQAEYRFTCDIVHENFAIRYIVYKYLVRKSDCTAHKHIYRHLDIIVNVTQWNKTLNHHKI